MAKSIVIGGGILGLWAAIKRQQHGHDVTIVDTYGIGNCFGSSGDTNRVIRSFYGGDETYAAMVAMSFADWDWLNTQSDDSIITNTKALWMVEDGISAEYPEKSLHASMKNGMHCYSIPDEEARRLYPQISFEGTSSLYIEEKAGYINALTAVKELGKIFLKSGGNLIEDKVTKLNISGNRLTSIETSSEYRTELDEVIISCGPWLNEITNQLLGYSVISVTRQEVLYFAHPEMSNDFTSQSLPVWIHFGEKIHYGIPGSKSIGFKIADDSRGDPFSPSHDERHISKQAIQSCRALLGKRFPALEKAALVGGKVCQYSNTVSGDYIIDFLPGVSNTVVIGAGNGHAFKNAPAIAIHANELLEGITHPKEKFALNKIKPEEKPGDQVTWSQKKSI